MLINSRISELQSNTSNSIPLVIIIAILFHYTLFQLLPYNLTMFNNNIFLKGLLHLISGNKNNNNYYFEDLEYSNETLLVTSKIWDGNLAEASHITSIGNIIYTNYNMWLIITSFILLLAMVGSIVITIKQK